MIECKCRIVWCDCGDEIVGQGATEDETGKEGE